MALKFHLIVCVFVCVLFLIATAAGWHLPESSGGGYGGGIGRGYGGSWGGGK
ncbi:hypothetical protein [Neorhodopirellula pilleata]|uniref:Uncharacterized protein n=1 Tax=Neorhodopirellula pilleata TaxID=2714738 RepID=A0A5C6A6I2_9BACT|nr:hypothetical protein [Neorhodopirellula pilleata]TWT94888.1 hypothetical protein Pla100_34590 [Neorhodopirellula pilleata]